MAAAVTMAAMGMAVAMEVVQRAAKTAIGRAAIGPALQPGHCGETRTAMSGTRLQPLRDGTERGASHQGQHDPA